MFNFLRYILIISVCFLSACKEDTIQVKYKIGFSQCTMSDSWRKNMQDGMARELSFYPEIRMTTTDAGGNNQKQIQQIQGFIEEKVDLIIASPNESEAITPIIEKAYGAGIPVILIDRRITSNNFTAFVGADNYLVGQNAGIYANTVLKGNGNVLEIGSGPNTSPTIGRHSGFLDALKKYDNIRCVKTFWNEEGYLDTLKKRFTASPPIDLIFTHNDRIAFQVYHVCDSLPLAKKVKIISVDGLAGENEGLDLVQKGKIDATILYPTGGEEAIKLAANILNKQSFQKENNLFTTVINAANVGIVQAQFKKVNEQQEDIQRQGEKIQELNKTYSSQRNRLYFMSILLSIVILLTCILLYLFREKQLSNEILSGQNQAILEQKNKIEEISQQARKANEEKLRFYSYISHEFRTPLSLILTPTEDLLHRKPIDAKETLSVLQLIQKNANRLLRLVDQLLELRKIDAGKMILEAQQSDLVAFIKDIVSDFSIKSKNQQIDLQFICPFPFLRFWFDAEKLDKVLFNLISNAFKYTAQGGLIHVSLFKNLDKIEIVVTDNGIGMTPEEREHAFDLFYRGSQNMSLGSGLGLALSHEFVQLHGGSIRLESEKGHGTTFKIILPFLQQDIISETPLEIDANPHFNHFVDGNTPPQYPEVFLSKNENTVVLIEDNSDLSTFLKERLSHNYNTMALETAEKGWENILAYIPDLIISDVMLPGMDGFWLTQKVKNDFRTSHIPVILLTAKGNMENQIEGTKAGADAYMSKPFNQNLLEERIKGLIENRDRMRRRFTNEIANPTNILKGERKFLIEFEALIEKTLADSTLSVEKLSHELGMSRVQLFRKISALTNKNVSDYIADFKLQKAKALLKNSEKTIAEIAYETGFNNPSYFTTFFKQKTNQAPSEWRNG
jgi:signal transduction histidine kinase/DNA-binding response OmpR family regulator